MLNFQHDDSRIRSAAEVTAGVTPVNYAYPPGDIRRYGAVDGEDCTEAIQAAVDCKFHTILIPEASSGWESGEITIDANTFNFLHIRGVGFKSIIKHTTGAKLFNVSGLVGSQINLLKFTDLYIDSDGNSDARNAIYFNQYAGRSFIEGCYFTGYSHSSGTFIDRGYCIYLDGGEIGLIRISKCSFGNGWGGIAISEANGVVIDSNIFESLHVGGPAIYIETAGNGIAITNNVMQTMGYGVLCAIATGVEISGNYFEGCEIFSLYLGTTSQIRGCNVSGNMFGGNTGTHHIAVDYCHGLAIVGNVFNTEGSTGLIKLGGAGDTVGVEIGVNGVSSAMVSGGYTLLTETVPLAFGRVFDPENFSMMYAGTNFAVRNPTNNGVHHVGSDGPVSMTDNQAFTLTMSASAAFIVAHDHTDGKSASFFVNYESATIVEVGDPSGLWSTTNTDTNPGMAIYKSANSAVVTVRNYNNKTMSITANVYGPLSSATAPA